MTTQTKTDILEGAERKLLLGHGRRENRSTRRSRTCNTNQRDRQQYWFADRSPWKAGSRERGGVRDPAKEKVPLNESIGESHPHSSKLREGQSLGRGEHPGNKGAGDRNPQTQKKEDMKKHTSKFGLAKTCQSVPKIKVGGAQRSRRRKRSTKSRLRPNRKSE